MELLLYAPNRPDVDFAVIFLWMMAVGTIIAAALWSLLTSEQTDERYNELSPKVYNTSLHLPSIFSYFLIYFLLLLLLLGGGGGCVHVDNPVLWLDCLSH